MKINDLSTGQYTLAIRLRKNGELRRLKGKIVERKGEKFFITHSSPKKSFASNTRVTWHRKEVKSG